MKTRCFLAVLFVVMVGCDQQQQALVPPQVPKQAPPPPVPTVSQPEAAKAHIQKYIVFGDNYPSALATIRIPGGGAAFFFLPGGGQNGRRP